MSGIDYSKWDKFADSDESDGSGEDTCGQGPHVTRLQHPSRVVVGPNGVHMEAMPPVAAASPFGKGGNSAATGNNDTSAGMSLGRHAGKDDNGGNDREEDEMMYNNLTRNGGREGQSHLWSQTRDTASVSFILPSMSTRAKDIMNFRIFSEEQEDKSSVCVLTFAIKGGAGDRRCVFRYPVKVSDDVVEGCWQLHSLRSKKLRLMVVQLVKESIAVGMSLWWDRCFATDKTLVDTRRLADRGDTVTERGEQFQKAWQEAHEEFRKRVNERRGRLPTIEEGDEENDEKEK